MPLQNRVTPEGEIIATPARGLFMGNRGRLHAPDKKLGAKRWTTLAWVTCRLSFKGRRRTLMAPGQYTELFFLDEAVALAAGHRPCGECRRDDYRAFRGAWARATGESGVTIQQLDRQMHQLRVQPAAASRSATSGRSTNSRTGSSWHFPGRPVWKARGSFSVISYTSTPLKGIGRPSGGHMAERSRS